MEKFSEYTNNKYINESKMDKNKLQKFLSSLDLLKISTERFISTLDKHKKGWQSQDLDNIDPKRLAELRSYTAKDFNEMTKYIKQTLDKLIN